MTHTRIVSIYKIFFQPEKATCNVLLGRKRPLLRLSITCGLENSKLNRQMRFSLPSIKCSAAPPSFRVGCVNCTQRFDLITARSGGVGRWEEPPNHLSDGSEKRICRLSFEF